LDLSVVILNWNTAALLEQCLETLVGTQSAIDYEIVVVDNNSTDNSREMVAAQFPTVRLIANTENLGFGAGNNVAVPQTTGRWILFLNSDTTVLPDALTRLVQFGDNDETIGIIGAKLLNPDGSLQYSCRQYPNLGTGFFRNTPLGRLFPNNKFASDYLMKSFDHLTPRDVDWVSGAALCIRRTLVQQIGAFDDDFFMYCEDVDLCWRANHAPLPNDPSRTWRVVYFPDAVIYHHIGKSSDLVPTRMTYEFHRSQYLFYKKHYAATMPFLLRPLIPLGIALRASGQVLRYRYRHYRNKLLGRWTPKPGRYDEKAK
jgi:GT2 family glycosyltransferase